jgi:taurine dioxygenase
MDGALGADVSDLDVRSIDAAQLAEIRAALLEYHVIALRDQQLDPAALSAFAARLGDREVYPFAQSLPDDPYVVPIVKEPEDESNFGGIWHTDSSYLVEPPGETLLYAVQIPSRGGDTWYADTQAAFEALSPAMQRLLVSLEGEYTAKLVHEAEGEHARVAGADRNRREAGERVTETVHPVVRTHPVSGRKAIYATLAHTRRFVGFTREESLPILEFLQRHSTQERFCTRLVWGQGTLALWDNRAVFHYPLNDYPGERREMHRVILAGERPC